MICFEGLELRLLLSASVPQFSHVVILLEENRPATTIYGNSQLPYLDSLEQGGAMFTQSYAMTHPSEPNYLALFSGSTQGVTDDGTYSFDGPNLATELQSAGLGFAGYAESPSVQKHDPWQSFTNSSADTIDFSQFPSDYSQLPAVSFVVPDLQDDMHDGTMQQADSWAQSNIGAYAQWAKSNNSLLIVEWDEDDGTHNNNIPTIIYGADVQPGSYSETINDYSILRTIEDSFGLAPLGASTTATPVTDIFQTASTPPTSSPPTSSPPTSSPPTLDPPAISSFQVNDGSAQRSMVDSLTLNFTEPVNIGSKAITLTPISQSTGASGLMTFDLSTTDNKTWTLTFTDPNYIGESLPDGTYTLTVSASGVTNSQGQTMSGGDQTFNFWRLYGDFSGQGTVSADDQSILSSHFSKRIGGPPSGSDWYLDYDGSGTINGVDFGAFAANYGKTISNRSSTNAVLQAPTQSTPLSATAARPSNVTAGNTSTPVANPPPANTVTSTSSTTSNNVSPSVPSTDAAGLASAGSTTLPVESAPITDTAPTTTVAQSFPTPAPETSPAPPAPTSAFAAVIRPGAIGGPHTIGAEFGIEEFNSDKAILNHDQPSGTNSDGRRDSRHDRDGRPAAVLAEANNGSDGSAENY
jgi:Phosphoesterase family